MEQYVGWDVLAENGDRYELKEFIGSGSEAAVFRAKLGRASFSLKVLDPHEPDRDHYVEIWRDAKELVESRHLPHIAHIIDVFPAQLQPRGRSASSNRGQRVHTFCACSPWIAGSNLYEFVHKRRGPALETDVTTILRLLRQLSDLVDEMHANHLVHRDIAPRNVLEGSRHVKLVDLSSLIEIPEGRNEAVSEGGWNFGGTPGFVAPESGRKGGVWRPASDNYSVAAIAFYLFTGLRVDKLTSPGVARTSKGGGPIPTVQHRAAKALEDCCPFLGPAICAEIVQSLADDWGDRNQTLSDWADSLIRRWKGDQRGTLRDTEPGGHAGGDGPRRLAPCLVTRLHGTHGDPLVACIDDDLSLTWGPGVPDAGRVAGAGRLAVSADGSTYARDRGRLVELGIMDRTKVATGESCAVACATCEWHEQGPWELQAVAARGLRGIRCLASNKRGLHLIEWDGMDNTTSQLLVPGASAGCFSVRGCLAVIDGHVVEVVRSGPGTVSTIEVPLDEGVTRMTPAAHRDGIAILIEREGSGGRRYEVVDADSFATVTTPTANTGPVQIAIGIGDRRHDPEPALVIWSADGPRLETIAARAGCR